MDPDITVKRPAPDDMQIYKNGVSRHLAYSKHRLAVFSVSYLKVPLSECPQLAALPRCLRWWDSTHQIGPVSVSGALGGIAVDILDDRSKHGWCKLLGPSCRSCSKSRPLVRCYHLQVFPRFGKTTQPSTTGRTFPGCMCGISSVLTDVYRLISVFLRQIVCLLSAVQESLPK